MQTSDFIRLEPTFCPRFKLQTIDFFVLNLTCDALQNIQPHSLSINHETFSCPKLIKLYTCDCYYYALVFSWHGSTHDLDNKVYSLSLVIDCNREHIEINACPHFSKSFQTFSKEANLGRKTTVAVRRVKTRPAGNNRVRT